MEFQPSDVFLQFITSIQTESENLKQKAENGEYQGTKEEINAQMQSEFLNRSYELLETAYRKYPTVRQRQSSSKSKAMTKMCFQ